MDIFLEVLDKLSSWLSLLPRISAKNIVEIAIISFLVYELLVWIKNTRAWTLLKGLLVIFAFSSVAKAAYWTETDTEARKRGEQTGLDTLVVHAVNDEY